MAFNRLIELGCDTIVELSPHPVLAGSIHECFQHRGRKARVLASLRRKEDERATMLRSLGSLYTLGCPINWSQVAPRTGRFTRFPTYAWQRERFWHESDESREMRLGKPGHPLLGRSLRSARPAWQCDLLVKHVPYLADHRVQGAVVLPATAYLEIAMAAVREMSGGMGCLLEDVKLNKVCFVADEGELRLQTLADSEEGMFQIHSREPDGQWTIHASGIVRRLDPEAGQPTFSPSAVQQRCPRELSATECYEAFRKVGLSFGPAFQGVERIWRGEREAIGLIRAPESLGTKLDQYCFHPAVLDSCFHVIAAADEHIGDQSQGLYLPVEIEQVRVYGRPGRTLWSHARLVEKTPRNLVADLDIYDEQGRLLAQVAKLRAQRMAGGEEESLESLLYECQWLAAPCPSQDRAACLPEINLSLDPVVAETQALRLGAPGGWLIFTDQGGVGRQLAERLCQDGQSCTLVMVGAQFEQTGNDRFQIRPGSREDMRELIGAVAASAIPITGIVHLWNLDAPASDELATAALEGCHDAGVLSVLQLVQEWIEAGREPSPRLWIVTRGAYPVSDWPVPPSMAQSAVCGLGAYSFTKAPSFAASGSISTPRRSRMRPVNCWKNFKLTTGRTKSRCAAAAAT